MEKEEIREAVAEFIEKILSLVPPYNEVSNKLIGLGNRYRSGYDRKYELTTQELSSFFPNLGFEDMSLLMRLFGFEMKSDGRIEASTYSSTFHPLSDLRDRIYEVFNDDEFRKRLSDFTQREIENPARKFVSAAIEAIKKHEKGDKAIDLLKVMSEEEFSLEISRIKNKLIDKEIKIEEDELKELLSVLGHSGLVYSRSGSYEIRKPFKKHIPEFLR